MTILRFFHVLKYLCHWVMESLLTMHLRFFHVLKYLWMMKSLLTMHDSKKTTKKYTCIQYLYIFIKYLSFTFVRNDGSDFFKESQTWLICCYTLLDCYAVAKYWYFILYTYLTITYFISTFVTSFFKWSSFIKAQLCTYNKYPYYSLCIHTMFYILDIAVLCPHFFLNHMKKLHTICQTLLYYSYIDTIAS